MGKLNLFYAPMNSGKSIDLIKTVYNYEENGFKVLVMKPGIDTKAGLDVETRAGLKRHCDYIIGPKDKVIKMLKGKLKDIKCVFIDEAQFLTKKQVWELFLISKSTETDIICYSLRTNFQMRCFEGSAALFEVADSIEELKTVCGCGKIARHVGRMVNGRFVFKGEEVVIDGEFNNIKYIPLCADCYLEKVLKIDLEKQREVLCGKRKNSNKS